MLVTPGTPNRMTLILPRTSITRFSSLKTNSVKKELGALQVSEIMERELGTATLAMLREKMAVFREKTIDEILDEV